MPCDGRVDAEKMISDFRSATHFALERMGRRNVPRAAWTLDCKPDISKGRHDNALVSKPAPVPVHVDHS